MRSRTVTITSWNNFQFSYNPDFCVKKNKPRLTLVKFWPITFSFYFTFNSSFHSINTRKKLQLHRPLANLASFQKGVYYVNTETLNASPISVAELVTDKKYFISALKRYLTDRSFYSVDGYLLTGVRWRLRHLALCFLVVFNCCNIEHCRSQYLHGLRRGSAAAQMLG